MIDEGLNKKLSVMFNVCSDLLDINHYDIYWKQGTCWSDKAAGEVKLYQDYFMGKVKINPHKAQSERDMLETVLHECVHIALSGYDTFLNVVIEGEENKQSRKRLKRLYTHFDEQATVKMTRALFPLALEKYEEAIEDEEEENTDE